MNKKLLLAIALLGLFLLAAAPDAVQEDVSAGGAITGIVGALILAVCILALLVTAAALLPGLHQRSLEALQRSPWRALGLGLVNYLFFGLLFALFANLGPLGLISILIGLALPSLTLIGLAALGRLVGERLDAWRQAPTSALTRLVLGSTLLELAIFVPLLGWFVLLPLACLAGLGGVVLAMFQRKAATSEA